MFWYKVEMSGNNSKRVGEIFTAAGNAFNTLGHLTMQLESAGQTASGPNTKWTEQEINMLANAVTTFANELNLISETIKGRTVHQIKGALQKKAYQDNGIVIQQATSVVQPSSQSSVVPTPSSGSSPSAPVKQNADVTLNALNASEVDVEHNNSGSDLHFDTSDTPDVKM